MYEGNITVIILNSFYRKLQEGQCSDCYFSMKDYT